MAVQAVASEVSSPYIKSIEKLPLEFVPRNNYL